MRLLVADIGGTNTRMMRCTLSGATIVPEGAAHYLSRQFHSAHEAAAQFMREHPGALDAAVFAVAGPVNDGAVRATNLPWIVNEESLKQALGLARVRLINDLEALAHGLDELGATDLVTLQHGDPATRGNRAVIAAGTGLGETGLYFDGVAHHPFATEGGHTDFAPRDGLECDLLAYAQARVGPHVSVERLLSGPGIALIYEFLRDRAAAPETPAIVRRLLNEDRAAVIAQSAVDGACQLCVRTLALFCSIYGAEAGNLALKIMARGGIYLGGGIAAKIHPFLARSEFVAAFCDKGRMRPLVEAIPVHVITHPDVALLGAARFAARAL